MGWKLPIWGYLAGIVGSNAEIALGRCWKESAAASHCCCIVSFKRFNSAEQRSFSCLHPAELGKKGLQFAFAAQKFAFQLLEIRRCDGRREALCEFFLQGCELLLQVGQDFTHGFRPWRY